MRRTALVTLSDPELAARSQGGDQDALEVLINRYRRFARARARGYFLTGGDADDVEQEALIGLYKAARDFRPEHGVGFRGFADLCITRQVISAIKAATRLKHRPLNQYVSFAGPSGTEDEREEMVVDVADQRPGADPVDHVVAGERAGALRASLVEAFSTLELEVLQLLADGHTYGEIGVRTGRHGKCVDNALQRSKRKLTLCLADC